MIVEMSRLFVSESGVLCVRNFSSGKYVIWAVEGLTENSFTWKIINVIA